MKKLSVIALSFALSACATSNPAPTAPSGPTSYDGQPHNYTDGGGGLEGLIKARYECLKELRGGDNSSSSEVNVNVNVNSYSGSRVLQCAEISMCVAGRGYLRTASGEVSLPKSYLVTCLK
jgi:hypothetical protein